MASSLGIAAPTLAGVTVSTYADQATWNGTPTLTTSLTPQALMVTNQQVTIVPENPELRSHTQTFRTGPDGFLLDRIEIYSGGKAGGTARLNIYPDPVGGEDTDGFVNTSFSNDLLGGGAGLEFTFNGSGGAQYLRLDLTGADEITLAPNQQYAVEIDVLSGQWSWLRSNEGTYPDGNLYHQLTEFNFNGTPPANNRGERHQVGSTPQRDAGLALFAGVPSMTVASRPDALQWPATPVHVTTTGSTNLPADFNTEVTLDPGGAATQTFTPDSTFKLDKLMIRAAGAPTTGELYLVQVDPAQGGTEADGFVNVDFGSQLLTGLPFTFSGTTGTDRTLLEFDLLGDKEITLQQGVLYALDLRNTGAGSMYWMRDENPYAGGNVYGANPALTGNRNDVAGGGRRDASLALFAAGVAGDYNSDGVVDAADYVVWREAQSTGATTLANRDPSQTGNPVGQADFNYWRARFGNIAAASSGTFDSALIPEPATWLLFATAVCLFAARRPRN